MWVTFRKFVFTANFLLLLCAGAASQNLTGIWRGYFITENYQHYKFEVQIGQTNTGTLKGVTYSYLDTRFYAKTSMIGTFNRSSKASVIQETKSLELRMSESSMACIMKCFFTYAKSGKEEFLEGTFTAAYEKSDPELGVKKGGDCGGGKVFLRKVTTSDFYIEPFLREKPLVKKTPPANNSTTKTPAPTVNKPAPNTPPKTNTVRVPERKPPPARPKTTEIVKEPVAKEAEPKKEAAIPKAITLPLQTRSRTNELVKTLTVHSEEITVRLYDNGEIDDDTISVYLDEKLILSNKRLTASPLSIKIKMDEENSDHVLVMIAENLGRIPPNTSLMIVQDGERRYEVRITSTEQKNAMVRFRYQKSTP